MYKHEVIEILEHAKKKSVKLASRYVDAIIVGEDTEEQANQFKISHALIASLERDLNYKNIDRSDPVMPKNKYWLFLGNFIYLTHRKCESKDFVTCLNDDQICSVNEYFSRIN